MTLSPTPPAAPRRILEDESGRRLRFLRRVGRAVALLLLAWLAIVFLGGIGVGPARHLPFGHLLRPTLAPAPLKQRPHVTPPKPADLTPAIPAPVVAALKPLTTTTATTKAKGKSASAPGRTATTTTHGKSAAAPGHTKTTTTTATTTHGNKPVAPPGQTRTKTNKGKKP